MSGLLFFNQTFSICFLDFFSLVWERNDFSPKNANIFCSFIHIDITRFNGYIHNLVSLSPQFPFLIFLQNLFFHLICTLCYFHWLWPSQWLLVLRRGSFLDYLSIYPNKKLIRFTNHWQRNNNVFFALYDFLDGVSELIYLCLEIHRFFLLISLICFNIFINKFLIWKLVKIIQLWANDLQIFDSFSFFLRFIYLYIVFNYFVFFFLFDIFFFNLFILFLRLLVIFTQVVVFRITAIDYYRSIIKVRIV